MPRPQMSIARIARAASRYLEQEKALEASADDLLQELWVFRKQGAARKIRMKHLAEYASIPAGHLSQIMAEQKSVTGAVARKLVEAHESMQRPALNL